MEKIDFEIRNMILLVHKHLEELFQLLVTCVRFLFTALFLAI